ncbi:MAG: hypothetical protein P8L37_08725, partial [Phycisphaerales bacterium]|nr:hypothetical protein [Phycisphaerales bacterium]
SFNSAIMDSALVVYLKKEEHHELACDVALAIVGAHVEVFPEDPVELLAGVIVAPYSDYRIRFLWETYKSFTQENRWGDLAQMLEWCDMKACDEHPYTLGLGSQHSLYEMDLASWPESEREVLQELLLSGFEHPLWISWVAMAVAGGDLPTCDDHCKDHLQPLEGSKWKAELALKACQRAADLWEEEADLANILLAEAYYKNQQYDKAVEYLQSGMAAIPDKKQQFLDLYPDKDYYISEDEMNERLENYKRARAAN